MKLEDLKVGETYAVDAPIDGPLYVPIWPADGPAEWIKLEGPLSVGLLAPDDEQS